MLDYWIIVWNQHTYFKDERFTAIFNLDFMSVCTVHTSVQPHGWLILFPAKAFGLHSLIVSINNAIWAIIIFRIHEAGAGRGSSVHFSHFVSLFKCVIFATSKMSVVALGTCWLYRYYIHVNGYKRLNVEWIRCLPLNVQCSFMRTLSGRGTTINTSHIRTWNYDIHRNVVDWTSSESI